MCGGLKENGTLRRGGLVGVGVVLVKEVCHWVSGLWCLMITQVKPKKTDHFVLPAYQDAARTMFACVLLCPTIMIMDSTSAL